MFQEIKSNCSFQSNILLLNKKRKSSESSFKSTEDELVYEKDNNIESYIKNKELIEKVIEVNLENDEFFAVVQKRMKNGKIKVEKINTKELKKENPWALIKFYENNNII